MPDPQLRDLVEAARQRSEAFLQQSHNQMLQNFQEHRAMAIGVPAMAAAGVAGAGLGGSTQQGTPAGRLMDTITQLVRRGATFGAGVAGDVVQPVFSAGQGAVQGIAGGGAFMSGAGAFGPAGVAGGSYMDMNQRMGFAQTAWTALGKDVPWFGKYAGQRLSMTREQATQMAQEDILYGVSGGARRGAAGVANAISFGFLNMSLRRQGLLMSTVYADRFAKHIQNQFRFVTKENLARAGMGEYAGAFETGITRGGATALSGQMAQELGGLEAEMGLAPEEIMTLQSRAAGMMGIQGINKMFTEGGGRDAVSNRLSRTMNRQTRSVKDIQQGLNLSEKEAEEFFDTIGQMYGTADRVAKMVKQTQVHAGKWGMNKRQVFDMMREFEDMGRTMAIGQEETGRVGMDYAGALRAQSYRGLMTRQELMRFGGRTEEEALQRQVMTRFQRNIQMYETGRLGGAGVLMTQNRGAFMQFMTGRMDPMELAGEVGRVYAENPWAGAAARFDPRTRRMAGRLGELVQFRKVTALRQSGMLLTQDVNAAISEFQGLTGLQDADAAQDFRRFMREQAMFGREAAQKFGKGDNVQRGEDLQNLFHRIQSEDLSQLASSMYGGDVYEATLGFYDTLTNGGKDRLRSDLNLEDELLKKSFEQVSTPGEIAAEMRKSDVTGLGKTIARFGSSRSAPTNLNFRQIARESQGAFSKDIRTFISPLIKRGIGRADLNTLIFGEASSDLGTRITVGENNLLFMSMNENGTFRIRSGEKEVESTSFGDLDRSLRTILPDVDNDVIKRAQFLIATRVAKGLGSLAGGGLETALAAIQKTGRIMSPARRAYEALNFHRYKGFAETVFGPTVDNMGSLTEKAADSERDTKTSNTLMRLGATGVYAFGRAFKRAGTGFGLEDGLGKVADIFGSTEEAEDNIRRALERANVPGWSNEKIGRALTKEGNERRELKQAIVGRNVVQEILNLVLKAQEAEKLEDPLGTTNRPMIVKPEGTTWDALVKPK